LKSNKILARQNNEKSKIANDINIKKIYAKCRSFLWVPRVPELDFGGYDEMNYYYSEVSVPLWGYICRKGRIDNMQGLVSLSNILLDKMKKVSNGTQL
jgi:hypothetical protein